jgi:uncharacterized protein YndB with AHSA1/START domain
MIMAIKKIMIDKDTANKKLVVVRSFDAPVAQVWNAWTQSELLDLWWAPRPWKAETKRMDFREGGSWLYCMAGPQGERSWCIVDFKKIDPVKNFTSSACFCDESGNKNPDFPSMDWKNEFSGTGAETKVRVEISFPTEADFEMIIKMGFEAGFTAGLNNLDELLSK